MMNNELCLNLYKHKQITNHERQHSMISKMLLQMLNSTNPIREEMLIIIEYSLSVLLHKTFDQQIEAFQRIH